jgi:hypothetical protein
MQGAGGQEVDLFHVYSVDDDKHNDRQSSCPFACPKANGQALGGWGGIRIHNEALPGFWHEKAIDETMFRSAGLAQTRDGRP